MLYPISAVASNLYCWSHDGAHIVADDPYENLMAVVSGTKTFHLSSPHEGKQLGAHTSMAEGTLRLESSSGEAAESSSEEDPLQHARLVRLPWAVREPTGIHHYAVRAATRTFAHLSTVSSNDLARARASCLRLCVCVSVCACHSVRR